ncbi:hypothetical protein CRENBAI_026869 [Crenichthys baileyi]|uniref:Uncharacterized protein n=1 Tax=Crenichthys baileyi TaxID=28760 RepID=A0AAV9RP32_9TELE
MIKIPRYEEKGLGMLCLQSAGKCVDDVTGSHDISRGGDIHYYQDDIYRHGGDPSHRYPKAPRAQEPQENHRRDYGNPPREEQERVPGEPASSHSAEAPGGCSDDPQTPTAAVYAREDPAMDSETRDLGTHHSPSRGPTEPRGPGPSKQPLGLSRHKPKHPTPDTENHKFTSGQRYQPRAGSVQVRCPKGYRTQEVVPFPPGGEDRQHQPRLVPAPPNPSDPNPDPSVSKNPHPNPERGPCTKDRSTWSKRARQPELPLDETVPTPHEPKHKFPHSATPNQETDIEHMPPNPNAMNPLPTGATGKTLPSTVPTTESPTPHQDGTNSPGKRSPATGKHLGPASLTTSFRNYTNRPHHRYSNDSPGRNIN